MSGESRRNPVEALAEDFLARYRRGERPCLEEYTGRHPDLAGQIRELFPALVLMEEAAPDEEPRGGAALTRLGEYRILREVGRGGMGVAYEAEQEALGRHVALKVLPAAAAADPVQLQRFHREAKAAARLHHTNIVPVFDVGEHQGTHYYAMQFIRGQGLDVVLDELRRLRPPTGGHTPATPRPGDGERTLTLQLAQGLLTRQGPPRPGGGPPPDGRAGIAAATPPPLCEPGPLATGAGDFSDPTTLGYCRAVARLGLQAAEALAHAHGQKILHRDIKPSNLLLDVQGTLWVTDFGLAKEEGDDLTRTGDLVGTLRYLAPERLRGQADGRSDVYSLGLTLHELLTLRPPFAGADQASLLRRIADEDLPRPRQLDPHVPRDLETLVLKATAKEPARRYASAEDLAEDLRRFLTDRPVRARRASWAEQTWRWCRRNRAVAALLASVALLLVLIGVLSTASAVRLGRELHRAEGAEEAEKGAHRAARERLCRALLNEANALRRSRLPGQRLGALEKVREAVAMARELGLPRERFDELRRVAISCLALPDVRVVKEWDGWPAGSDSITFDPAFTYYARSDTRGKVTVRRPADNQEVAHLDGAGYAVAIRFSPDGRALAVMDGYQRKSPLKVWNLAGGQPALVLHEPRASAGAWDFRPDGSQLAVGLPDGLLRIFDLKTGRVVREWPGVQLDALRYHPWLGRIAGCDGVRTTLCVYDTDSGQRLASCPVPSGMVQDWHPDGRSVILSADEDLSLRLWDVETRHITRVLRGRMKPGIRARVAPSGDLLASTDWHDVVRVWDLGSGQELLSMPGWLPFAGPDRLCALQRRGTRLTLFQMAPAPGLRTVRPPSASGLDGYGWTAVDPKGRFLASGRINHESTIGLALLDARTGRELSWQALPGGVMPDRFMPSGELLTHTTSEILLWPVSADPHRAGWWKMGPPRILARGYNLGPHLGASDNGQVLALPSFDRGSWLLHPERRLRVALREQKDVRFCAVNPDGGWVASGSHWPQAVSVKVWDGRTGKHVKDLPVQGSSCVGFGPDGHWLATTGGGVRLWKAGSWEEGPKVQGELCAFSADGRILAVTEGLGVVRLYNPDSGAEYARWQSPEHARLTPRGFSPDGRFLYLYDWTNGAVHMWDLARINAELDGLGLSWDLPLPPPAPAALAPAGLSIETGNLDKVREAARLTDQARQASGQRRFAEAIRLLRQAVERDPEQAGGLNLLAWLLLTGPSELRDAAAALPLARKAVAREPGAWLYCNTLGVACYRNGRYREAITCLEDSLRRGKSQADAFDLFFLAMCRQQLGDEGRARDCYQRACRWTDGRWGKLPDSWREELTAFRVEAATLLGLP
jgi:serine/threonine protein kinase/WD40 repeat protein